MGDDGLLLAVPVVPRPPGAPQHRGDVQQLPGRQAPPHVRPLEAGRHRLHPGEAGAPPQNEHLYRGGGLLLRPGHVVQISEGTQCQAALLSLQGGRAVGKKSQHLGQLQGGHRFFKQFTHIQNSWIVGHIPFWRFKDRRTRFIVS